MFVPHIMPPAPKNPRRDAAGKRFGNVVRVVAVARSRSHLRALRGQALSSLRLVQLRRCTPRFRASAAGTLDPAPSGGKERPSVLLPQNPLGNGFAKRPHEQEERLRKKTRLTSLAGPFPKTRSRTFALRVANPAPLQAACPTSISARAFCAPLHPPPRSTRKQGFSKPPRIG